MRTREALSALIEARLASPAGRSQLVELARSSRRPWRARCGTRARSRLLRARGCSRPGPSQPPPDPSPEEEGGLEDSAPQVACLAQPLRAALRDHLKGHTEALESLAVARLARGLSVRDIEDAFRDETGRLLLSKTAVAEIGKQLWEDDQAFKSRDLAEYEIASLFIDGIAEARRRLKIIPNAFGDVRRDGPGGRTLAIDPGQRVRAPPDGWQELDHDYIMRRGDARILPLRTSEL